MASAATGKARYLTSVASMVTQRPLEKFSSRGGLLFARKLLLAMENILAA